MDDSLGVNVVEGRREFREPPEHELLVKVGHFDIGKSVRGTVLVNHEIHYEVRRLGRLVEVEVKHAYDVWMVEPRKNPTLGKELFLEDVDVPVFERERLQRIVDAELRVYNLVHRTHRAFTEETDDAVHADRVIWIERCH